MVKEEPEDFYFQDDFRLYPKHLQGMEMDASIVECVTDSSMIDNIIGHDSLILSALKNGVKGSCVEIARTWKSIVVCFFGTDEGLSQNEDDIETPQETSSFKPGTLQYDHQVLQEKWEKVLDGGDVKALFPVSHKEKFLYLDDREENEEDWKSELDHVEGLLASRAVSVIKVDWKDPGLPCQVPNDIHFLLHQQDIEHLNSILQDDDNDCRFFHQFGLLNAYLQVAPEGSDDAHKYRRIPKIAHQYAFECSNGCENIFTKDGRNKTIRDSNVYVMNSEVNASDFKRLWNISAFLKGENFYELANYPTKAKIVQWVAGEDVKAYLEEDLEFFEGLEHNVRTQLPGKVKKALKHHFMSLEEKYEMPSSFQLTLLHPYLAYIQSNVEDNDNNCLFGFADTQNAICTAFLYDTIPYMKTIERMTNPCFQDTPFASVMKGKHVLNEPDETDLESYHIEESSGQALVGDREEDASNKRKRKDPPLPGSDWKRRTITLPMYGSSYGYGTNLIAGGDVASHSGSEEFDNSESFSVGEQGEGNQSEHGEGNQRGHQSGAESLAALLSQATQEEQSQQVNQTDREQPRRSARLTRSGEGNQSGSESLGLLLSQAIGAYEGNQSASENLETNLFQAVQASLSRSSQAEPGGEVDAIGNLFSQMDQSNPAETQRPGQTTKKKRGAQGNTFAAIRRGQRLRLATNRYAPTCTPTPDTFAPENDYSPPAVTSSILLPIQVTREKLNCAFGNAVNLLTYINHFNTGLKQKMMMLGVETQGCRFGEIQRLIHQCGYDVNVLPKMSTFTELESFVTRMDLPMLINLELKFPSITLGHVIGISPYKSSDTSQIEYHIIDGAHPEMKAMHFNKENIDWCCGNDLKLGKINQGFVFVPGRKRVLEMLQDKSGYHIVPGTAVCLTKNAKNIGKGDVKLPVIHERVLALNVSDKEKSEYVKIWKQLMDEHKKKK
jgi:hypothetical protein